MELWNELFGRAVNLPLPHLQPGMPKVASPELIALQKEAAELPRWPGEDVLADAVLSYLQELHRLHVEVQPAFAELVYGEGPRDADLAQAELIWEDIEGVRFGGANAVKEAFVAFGSAQGVRMEPAALYALPAATGADLPGGEMRLPESYRRLFATAHLSEVRGLCNQGVMAMNQAVDLSTTPKADFGPIAESLAQTREEMDAVPAWVEDGEFRDACSAVLQAQAGVLEQQLPALQEALEKGDTDTFNSSAGDLSAELRALQLDLHTAEASFRARWGLQERAAPEQQADRAQESQALSRLRHWSGLVNEAVFLGTQMRINLLLDGAEYETQSKLVSVRLAELQSRAEMPPPFDGEDPLRKPASAVLDVLEQSFGDWGEQATVLLHTPKPREAHQQRYQALVEEEGLAVDTAVAEYQAAHKAFAESRGITVVSTQTLDSFHPPSFVVTLPGPEVKLSAQVRITFAAGHMMEVDRAFSAGLEAWNGFVTAPAEEWPDRLPQTRAVVAAASKEVLSIPPWMGEETLIEAAEGALGIWLDALDKGIPRMIKLLAGDRTQRDVDQYNKLLDELNSKGTAGVAGWNDGTSQWAEDWQFDASQAHQEAMVQWAQDSRELLK
jgi:hypothetical protein